MEATSNIKPHISFVFKLISFSKHRIYLIRTYSPKTSSSYCSRGLRPTRRTSAWLNNCDLITLALGFNEAFIASKLSFISSHTEDCYFSNLGDSDGLTAFTLRSKITIFHIFIHRMTQTSTDWDISRTVMTLWYSIRRYNGLDIDQSFFHFALTFGSSVDLCLAEECYYSQVNENIHTSVHYGMEDTICKKENIHFCKMMIDNW